MLRTSDLDFTLPSELIATIPAEPRDSARLLVTSRTDPALLQHRAVRDLPEFLRAGDLLVVNDSRVIPARFEGVRKETGGRVPGLYLGPAIGPPESRSWLVYLKGGHLRATVRVVLGPGVEIELIEKSAEEPGAWLVSPHGLNSTDSDLDILARIGSTPLPPYILAARKSQGLQVPDDYDRNRYQTTYASDRATTAGGPGSVAAPTAGLHFTAALLAQLESQGVHRASVTLHVGSGTFKPIETEFVQQHPIHSERCSMDPATIDAIRRTRAFGGRVIAVGTTAARVIETYANIAAANQPLPATLDTRIFITPGYQWKWVDGLLTNFHLPQSTLLAMVSSLFDSTGGIERLKTIYAEAIRERYRFFSYGDAMLVLP